MVGVSSGFGPSSLGDGHGAKGPRADRAAVVVERDLDFGIMRQWFAYSENGHGRRELFRALAPAEAWLAQ